MKKKTDTEAKAYDSEGRDGNYAATSQGTLGPAEVRRSKWGFSPGAFGGNVAQLTLCFLMSDLQNCARNKCSIVFSHSVHGNLLLQPQETKNWSFPEFFPTLISICISTLYFVMLIQMYFLPKGGKEIVQWSICCISMKLRWIQNEKACMCPHSESDTRHLPWGSGRGDWVFPPSLLRTHLFNASQLLPWSKGVWKQCLEGIISSDSIPICGSGRMGFKMIRRKAKEKTTLHWSKLVTKL